MPVTAPLAPLFDLAEAHHHAVLTAGFGDRVIEPPAACVLVRQVHGRQAVVVDDLAPGEHEDVAADVLIATQAGVIAGVKTADCVPVLLVSPDAQWAAAVHAGWRGTLAGAVGAALEDAQARRIPIATLRAAIGPSIGPCCYVVGEDVAQAFRERRLAVDDGGLQPRIDLAESNRRLLVAGGLRDANIAIHAVCTKCHGNRYYSFRASPGTRGRQVSWIGWAERKGG